MTTQEHHMNTLGRIATLLNMMGGNPDLKETCPTLARAESDVLTAMIEMADLQTQEEIER